MEKELIEKENETNDKMKFLMKAKNRREDIQRNVMIGYRIRQLRLDHNYTQSQVADVLNVSSQHYGTLERGVNPLTLENIIVLSNLYKVSLISIIGDINERKASEESKKLIEQLTKLSKEHKETIEYMVEYFNIIESKTIQEKQKKTEQLLDKAKK